MKKKQFERKWKRSLIYTQCGKKIEEELTYERFENELAVGFLEFWFKYLDRDIDIAFHYEKEKKIYELNINDQNDLNCENGYHQYFDSTKELLENGRIDGKTIKEVWEELEN